uniref:Putative ovule protein n=1 Tax=Solanum chacoense TaxID=4108 RepID=A0A0V0HP38_SOLCH
MLHDLKCSNYIAPHPCIRVVHNKFEASHLSLLSGGRSQLRHHQMTLPYGFLLHLHQNYSSSPSSSAFSSAALRVSLLSALPQLLLFRSLLKLNSATSFLLW